MTAPTYAQAVYEVARKELLDHIRTKRIYIIGGFFAVAFLALTFITGRFTNVFLDPVIDSFGGNISKANAVIYIYLSIPIIGGYTFMQLLGIALSWDAVVREWEDKSIFLLLSKPVTRVAVFLGKFFGTLASVAVVFVPVTVAAYLLAILIVQEAPSAEDAVRALGAMGFVVLGLGAFVSMGLLTSTLVRSTTTSVMLSLGLWLIVLPLLGRTGFFYEVTTQENPNIRSGVVEFFYYFNPDYCMSVASKVLLQLPDQAELSFLDAFAPTLVMDIVPSIIGMLVFTGVCVSLGAWVVARRDFT